MTLTQYTFAPGAVQQVLDNFVGSFKLGWPGEISFDGGATYVAQSLVPGGVPWGTAEGLKVCAPLTLWVRNQSASNQTFSVLTWN